MTAPETPRADGARGPRRRSVLLSGLVGAGAGVVTGAGAAVARESSVPTRDLRLEQARALARGFRGEHQAGILEAPPPAASFVALDLAAGADRDAVRRLLTVWTDDIERLTTGHGTLTDLEPELAAVPASLTVTVAVGQRVVEAAGAQVPAWLAPLPAFPEIDRLEDRWGEADLLLQVCADSPTTVAHAQRRLVVDAGDLVVPRWVQRGFREPFEGPGVPMRNLFGQVDGTVQPDVTGLDADLLWSGDDGPAWLRGGSSLVVRRIRMDLDQWDRVDRLSRENAVGRRLDTGGPVTGGGPETAADLEATDDLGFHVVDDGAHLRRAHATAPHERFLRRPYSFDDAPEGDAVSNSGLVFVTYQADPMRQLVPVQRRLAEMDLLNIWTTPVGSAVFAVLPGARDGEILGQAMLG